MLQTLTHVICCEDKQLAEDRTRRTIDVIYSRREYIIIMGCSQFRLISILNSNGSSLLLYIILYIK